MPTLHTCDVLVIGAGGAGLMAALHAADSAQTIVLSKLHPMRSTTGSAQGGIGAALGNLEEDHPEWHALDTVKGSDYLGDQDAVEFMCAEAPQAVYDLEHLGLPFSRTIEGRIAQRPFGGHTNNETGRPVRRSCFAADRTGLMILQTLYQNCLRRGIQFFDEFQVLDLLISNGAAAGAAALQLSTGELHLFQARAVILATGGHGRLWQVTSNPFSSTGDGPALALRQGLPLMDMEFFQFHPTGLHKLGLLVTEAVRGEGGVLLNGLGERFMLNYAPRLKDLASRDMVSRAMYLEMRAGRGIGGQPWLHLDARPETINTYAERDGRTRPDGSPYRVSEADLLARIPDVIEFCRTYLGLDALQQPIPVVPTAHYAMGGIPTDLYGRVCLDEGRRPLPGLFAAGECACVSVHGANRLGTNSLLDLVVFGKHAGLQAALHAAGVSLPALPSDPAGPALARLQQLREGAGSQSVAQIGAELRALMSAEVGVFRSAAGLAHALDEIRELRERYQGVRVSDPGRVFNTEMLAAWELGNLLDLALVTAASASARTESRGAHAREDFPRRDDARWLKHSLAWLDEDGRVRLGYRPVVVTHFPPRERTY